MSSINRKLLVLGMNFRKSIGGGAESHRDVVVDGGGYFFHGGGQSPSHTGGLEMPETLVDVRERKEDWRDFIDIHECVICV